MSFATEIFRGWHPILQALAGGGFTWALTAIGAGFVSIWPIGSRRWLDGMLGFTGGVMIAASYWSLLAPAIEMSPRLAPGLPTWFPAATGFLFGGLFLLGLDNILPHLHLDFDVAEKEGIETEWHRTILMVLAITLHNIPEGLAIGVSFGALAHDIPGTSLGGAIALSLGIGIQNAPEGIAVAVPLRRAGVSKLRSFWYGQLSAIVEPIAAVLGAAAVLYTRPALPYALAFAAGAMIYVVIEEVVPETQQHGHSDSAAVGFLLGFLIMMILDVALG